MATASVSGCGKAVISISPGLLAPVNATRSDNITWNEGLIGAPPGLEMGIKAPAQTNEFPKKQRGTRKARGQKQVEVASVQQVATSQLPRLLGAGRMESLKCLTKYEGDALEQNSSLTRATDIQRASHGQQEGCLRNSVMPLAADHIAHASPNPYAIHYELRPPPGLEAYGTSEFVGYGCPAACSASTRSCVENTLDDHSQGKHKPMPSWLSPGQAGNLGTPDAGAPSASRSALRAKGTEALAKLGAPTESKNGRKRQPAAFSLDGLRTRGNDLLADVSEGGQRLSAAGKTSQKPGVGPKLHHASRRDHRSTVKQAHGPTMPHPTQQEWGTENCRDQFIDNALDSNKENLSTESCAALVPSGMPMKVELASLVSV